MTNSTTADTSLSSFESALVFNAAVAAAFFIAFTILRSRFPQTYSVRVLALGKPRLPTPPVTKITWPLLATLTVSNDEFVEKCGQDAFAAVYYVRTMAYLFLTIGLPATIFLLPINITGDNNLSGLNILSYGNVANENKLWAHFLFTIYVVFVTLFYIFQIIAETARLRQSFQSSNGSNSDGSFVAARTLLVRDVPEEWRNSEALERIFNRISAGSVQAVIIPKKVPKAISKITAKQLKIRNNLESAVSSYFSKLAKHFHMSADPAKEEDSPVVPAPASSSSEFIVAEQPQVSEQKPQEYGHSLRKQPTKPISDSIEAQSKLRPKHKETPLIGKTVDSIVAYSQEFRLLDYEGTKTRASLGLTDDSNETGVVASSAFIVFKEPFQTHLASRVTVHDAPTVMGTKIGYVDAKDVIWGNTSMNYFDRQWRSIVVSVIVILMTIFWAAIVAFVLSFADLDSLSQNVSFIKDFLNSEPALAKILSGVLPSVIIAVLLSLVPTFLRLFSVFSGSPLRSQTEQIVFSQYFTFQIVVVFVVNIIGSSILASLQNLEANPSSVMNILAESVPKSANFFIQYLLVLGLSSPSSELLQIAKLIVGPILAALFGKTPRSLLNTKKPPQWFYATAMAVHGLAVTIGLVYCILAPIIICFVAIYFVLYTVVYSYMMQYVYVMPRQTGGKFLYTAAHHIFIGLFIMEFVILALFILSKNYVAGGLILFVVFISLWAQSQARQFISVIETIPVKTIMDLEGTDLPQAPIKAGRDINSVIAFMFPGLTKALEFGVHARKSAKIDAVEAPEAMPSVAELRKLFADPAAGLEALSVWIPKSGVWGASRGVEKEIIGDEKIIDTSRVVTLGAGVDVKGKIVIVDGMADVLNTL
ncbi:hypothetical protein HK100_002784 [Physocladia obscura]|uniref:DUF221-domain-containing protein n=1 Tax=Physocladia obscura TaxID=109957 RepID=A0AAD5TCZ2_9FUNG|nr:hypothetical protein HK100_002784 [Physocladia obscura]